MKTNPVRVNQSLPTLMVAPVNLVSKKLVTWKELKLNGDDEFIVVYENGSAFKKQNNLDKIRSKSRLNHSFETKIPMQNVKFHYNLKSKSSPEIVPDINDTFSLSNSSIEVLHIGRSKTPISTNSVEDNISLERIVHLSSCDSFGDHTISLQNSIDNYKIIGSSMIRLQVAEEKGHDKSICDKIPQTNIMSSSSGERDHNLYDISNISEKSATFPLKKDVQFNFKHNSSNFEISAKNESKSTKDMFDNMHNTALFDIPKKRRKLNITYIVEESEAKCLFPYINSETKTAKLDSISSKSATTIKLPPINKNRTKTTQEGLQNHNYVKKYIPESWLIGDHLPQGLKR